MVVVVVVVVMAAVTAGPTVIPGCLRCFLEVS